MRLNQQEPSRHSSASGAPEHSRSDLAVLMVAAATVATMRWWSSHDRTMIQLRSDEAGQVGMARTIGGGTTWNMFSNVTWRPGYATLVAPLRWVFDDPVHFYRSMLVTNAVLGSVSVVLLALIARRLLDVSLPWAAVAATIVSCLPGVVLMSNWVWPESLVQTLFLGTILAGIAFVDDPTTARAAGLAGVVMAGYFTHGRLGPLVVLAGSLVVVAGFRSWIPKWHAAAIGAASLIVLVALEWYADRLTEQIWTRALSTNTPRRVVGNLRDPMAVAISGAGQVWYQIVATGGLAAAGALFLVRALIRPVHPRERSAAAVILGATVPVVFLAAIFLSNTPQMRADYVVYGRYLDAVMAPIVLAGLALLAFGTTRQRVGSVAAGVGLAMVVNVGLDASRAVALAEGSFVEHQVVGVLALVGDARPVDLARATAIGSLVAAGLVGAALVTSGRRHGRWWVLAAPALAVAVSIGVTDPVVQRRADRLVGSEAVAEVHDAGLPRGARVLYDLRNDAGDRRVAYQFHLPDNRIDGLSDRDRLPATPWLFARTDDERWQPPLGELIWSDPQVPIGLYRIDAWHARFAERRD